MCEDVPAEILDEMMIVIMMMTMTIMRRNNMLLFQDVCEDVPEEVCETVMEKSCRTVQEEVDSYILYLPDFLIWIFTVIFRCATTRTTLR